MCIIITVMLLKGSCLSSQPVFHDCNNKGRGVRYTVCGMVHIKEPLLLIEKVAHIMVAAGFLSR